MIIKSIELMSGRSQGEPPQKIDVSPVTVFVGPNNSGKSKTLSEIEQSIVQTAHIPHVIIKEIEYNGIVDPDLLEKEYQNAKQPSHLGVNMLPGHDFFVSRRGNYQAPKDWLLSALQNPLSNLDIFKRWLSSYVLMLGGSSRITMVNSQQAGDFQSPPQSSFQKVFQDDGRRADFRSIVHPALGFYPVIDPTSPGTLRLRMSDHAPTSSMEERGWHKEAVAFHSRADSIETASDGVKAFSGMILELIAGDPRVLLIDEPEAFLHPALAFKLGVEIGRLSSKEHKNVFVSTHSSSFLMGCIQSGSPLSIVRLTYTNKSATSRVLPNENIVSLMRNPLLRSSGVISALFYEFVIVTESDTDRAFYNEINERLVRYNPQWGIPNCLFLNSQNKHTLGTIMKPLRDLGIPTACIVDIDVLKDGGASWTKLLDAANVPRISQAPLGLIRSSIHDAMKNSGKDMKRDGGVDILSGSDKQAAEDLFGNMADYGIFVVQDGELESWLNHLGATGHGPPWLIDVFERMGEDPAAPSYVIPGTNDVWKFMSSIRAWLTNSSRKGIPI